MSGVERPNLVTCITKPIPEDIFRRYAIWSTKRQRMESASSLVSCNGGESTSVGKTS
jgi:hypothetical protein